MTQRRCQLSCPLVHDRDRGGSGRATTSYSIHTKTAQGSVGPILSTAIYGIEQSGYGLRRTTNSALTSQNVAPSHGLRSSFSARSSVSIPTFGPLQMIIPDKDSLSLPLLCSIA
jgi:hypothetical protein